LLSSRQPFAAALVAVAVIAASAQEARLRIVSPTESTYLVGSARLHAVVEPSSAERDVEKVTFFVGATQVCEVTKPPFECEWDAGERVQGRQVRVAATMKSGERLVQTVTTKKLEVVETVDVDVVQITAVVTDNQGRFVSGLKPSDFKVSEDGVQQKLSSFSDEHTPLELITAIDVSSSVNDALPGMKTAATRFVSALEPSDQVTVLGFNDIIFTLAKRSTDQVVRERAIGRLRAWGGTALYDAIVQGIDLLGRQQGRRAIVLFTDGKDENSHAPIETAIAQVEASDAMIYPVGQGRAIHEKDLQKLLQRVATTSGGRAFFSDTPAKLDQVFSEILEDLHHQYLLSYPAPEDKRDGKYHKIKVVAAGGKYRVRARDGYRYTQKR
jgi:Ca-activated chloride channel family protein